MSRAADASIVPATQTLHRQASMHMVFPFQLTIMLSVALLVRVIAAIRLSAHVDEASSVLAARMVTDRGVPLLPSGVLYLQGTLESYLWAPLIAAGWGEGTSPLSLRLVSAVAGSIAAWALYRATLAVTDSPAAALFAAWCLAVDPLSVQWSGHARMYAALQALTLIAVWIVLEGVLRGFSSKKGIALGVTLWAVVLTQVAGALILLPMTMVAAMLWRRRWTGRRSLAMALLAGAIAPVILGLLNWVVGPGNPSANTPLLSFAGAQVLDLASPGPTFEAWKATFAWGPFSALLPNIMLGISGILVLFAFWAWSRGELRQCFGTLTILAVYWVPAVLVAFMTEAPHPRYVLNVHPLAFSIIASAAVLGWRCAAYDTRIRPRERVIEWLTRAGTLALMVLVIINGVIGLRDRFNDAVVGPDYSAAFAFVKQRRAPGEPVLVSLPPIAYLELGTTDGLYFLAGPAHGIRTERYTRQQPDGKRVDIWLGVDAVASTKALCALLLHNPRTWIVIDEARIWGPWAYRGQMAEVLLGMTHGVYRAPGGALVRRVAPPALRVPQAEAICSSQASSPSPPPVSPQGMR